MWTVTTLFLLRLMQEITRGVVTPGVAGVLNGAWLGLYQQGTNPITPQSTMANIVEANYDGYSRQQIVWFPPWISAGGPELIAAQDLWYSPTDALKPNLITGVFIADAFYGGNLLMAAALAVPGVSLGSPSQALKVQPQFSLPFLQIYGSPAVVS